jgi:hypothetical protein
MERKEQIEFRAGSILTFYITLDYAENKIKKVEKQILEYIVSK